MIEFILVLGMFSVFFFVAYKVTGAIQKALIWLFVLVPIAILLWVVALVCCCTILLIPVGIKLFTAGCRVLLAG